MLLPQLASAKVSPSSVAQGINPQAPSAPVSSAPDK
jgi:hypothetical protein